MLNNALCGAPERSDALDSKRRLRKHSSPVQLRYEPRKGRLGVPMPDTKMPPRVDDPGYWRFRAENARTLAKDVKEAEAQSIILNIAQEYEHLARLAEERRRTVS